MTLNARKKITHGLVGSAGELADDGMDAQRDAGAVRAQRLLRWRGRRLARLLRLSQHRFMSLAVGKQAFGTSTSACH